MKLKEYMSERTVAVTCNIISITQQTQKVVYMMDN